MTSNKIRGAEDSTLAHKSRGRGAGRDELSLPALVVGAASAHWHARDGGGQTLSHATAAAYAARQAPLVCHAAATARRLRTEPFAAYDLLELYAFVRPARFCTPTPRGLARALGLPVPAPLADQAALLPTAAGRLLQELSALEAADRRAAWAIAWTLTQAGWAWGPAALKALGGMTRDGPAPRFAGGLQVWQELAEWSDHAPEAPPGNAAVEPGEARARLAALLGEEAEARPQQADYASAVSQAFQPRERAGEPAFVLAEAGTGVGKTLGYIAPASLWAEKNHAAVWISTFTRNLQHQIDGELDRLFPHTPTKARRVVIRKGRENYLCLLNLEEAVSALPTRPENALAVALMARWAARTRDGDMVGGDFPGWLPGLVGRGRTLGLTDRRGECIHSACSHYGKCFIEKSLRRARRAEIVVANHALVMIQAALGGGEEGALATRFVFDEGHHLFDAADSAFAAHLTGMESHDLRRWLLGGDGASRSAGRLRGLKRRIEDLLIDQEEAQEALEAGVRAAQALPGEAWQQRLSRNEPLGRTEAFLSLVRQQVYARAHRPGDPYSLETEPLPAVEGLLDAAAALRLALETLARPLARLEALLAARLEDEADSLDSETRRRIEAITRGLKRRALLPLRAWQDMLTNLEEKTPEDFVDWFGVERLDGRDIDVGFYRHWVDPTRPLAAVLTRQAHGIVVTSATLTDGSGDPERDWTAAEARTGALHLEKPAIRARVASPFDYGALTRVFIVGDVRKDDLGQVAAAYRALFVAAGGGALGLFTAISRLRAVQQRIAPMLESEGLELLAQHVDGLDTATLIDIFRAEENSCLLGTDAVRDGVDVPGRSLRLIVFDRVPWPRPDLRHKARRELFGGRHYDDMLTRLKLKQAFGRLVRRADDRGVFVLLDPMMPSRLLGAFPEAVEAQRVGLAEAVAETRDFLNP